jgi:hypothetical protein
VGGEGVEADERVTMADELVRRGDVSAPAEDIVEAGWDDEAGERVSMADELVLSGEVRLADASPKADEVPAAWYDDAQLHDLHRKFDAESVESLREGEGMELQSEGDCNNGDWSIADWA